MNSRHIFLRVEKCFGENWVVYACPVWRRALDLLKLDLSCLSGLNCLSGRPFTFLIGQNHRWHIGPGMLELHPYWSVVNEWWYMFGWPVFYRVRQCHASFGTRSICYGCRPAIWYVYEMMLRDDGTRWWYEMMVRDGGTRWYETCIICILLFIYHLVTMLELINFFRKV